MQIFQARKSSGFGSLKRFSPGWCSAGIGVSSNQQEPGSNEDCFSSGFTLIELLIVLAIFSIVLGMIFSSLGESQNASTIARDESQMHQNLEDILSLMNTELRAIGSPPETYYDTNYLQNPGTDKNLVALGLMQIGPQLIKFQGDIDGDGRVDYVYYYLSGSGAPYSLNRFAGEIHPDGSLPGGSPQKLSEQIEGLQFRYFNQQGAETSVLSEVATIEIQLTLRSKQVDPLSKIYRTVTEIMRIHPLNL